MERISWTKWDKPSPPPLSYVKHNLDTNGRVYPPKIQAAILDYFAGSRPRDINQKYELNEEERKTVENAESRIKKDFERGGRRGFSYTSDGRHFSIRGIAGDV